MTSRTPGLRPLSERVLAALPGRRAAWMAVWALVPWLNAAGNLALGSDGTSAVWDQRPLLVVLNYAALSAGVVLSLWGSARIAATLERLGVAAERSFRALGAVAGPLLATVATATGFGLVAQARDGWAAGALRGLTWLALGLALWTFLWTYGALQLGLYRLGRTRTVAPEAAVDPGLGLRPFGSVAFTGLWVLLAWLVPVVLTALPDGPGVALGLLLLAAALASFFLSLYGLHRRMLAAKAEEVAIARALYAEAYAPVRAERTLESLERQRALLGAADALEKRATAIHEWPIDEATFARVVTITTSVIAMTIGRLILDPLGL